MSRRLEAALAELAEAIREEVTAAAVRPAPDRLLAIDEAAAALSIGRSRLYDEIGAGRLRSMRVGRRRLVPAAAIGDYIRKAAGEDQTPPAAQREGIPSAPAAA